MRTLPFALALVFLLTLPQAAHAKGRRTPPRTYYQNDPQYASSYWKDIVVVPGFALLMVVVGYWPWRGNTAADKAETEGWGRFRTICGMVLFVAFLDQMYSNTTYLAGDRHPGPPYVDDDGSRFPKLERVFPGPALIGTSVGLGLVCLVSAFAAYRNRRRPSQTKQTEPRDCLHCNASLSPAALTDGWCSECGKKLPVSWTAVRKGM